MKMTIGMGIKRGIKRLVHSLTGGAARLFICSEGHWQYSSLMCAAIVERVYHMEFDGDERMSLSVTASRLPRLSPTARLPRRMTALRSSYRVGLAAALRPSAMAEEKSRPARLMSLALCIFALWRKNMGLPAESEPRWSASLAECRRLVPGRDGRFYARAVELYNGDWQLRSCVHEAVMATRGDLVVYSGDGARVTINVLKAGWGEKEDE